MPFFPSIHLENSLELTFSVISHESQTNLRREILTPKYIGSFGNIFSRNSINNALLTLEVPKLVERLREVFSSNTVSSQQNDILELSKNRDSLDLPPSRPQSFSQKEKKLTRRTNWYIISKLLLLYYSHNYDLRYILRALLFKLEKERLFSIRIFTWDITRSIVTVREGTSGPIWTQNVGALSPNVQDIIVSGGLEEWVKKQIGGS